MKYPRTSHLPTSPGGTRDDRRLPGLESFVDRRLVATEKADGSNVCLEREGCFARSHGHAPVHPSFDALKALHARVRGLIDPGVQVFGEWLYARHSIRYSALPSYFLVIRVRDTRTGLWTSWEDTERWAEVLALPTVPVLGTLTNSDGPGLERFVTDLTVPAPSRLGGEREGFVMSWANEFGDADFEQAVGKWVRKDHVTSGDHWSHQTIVRNGVKNPH